MAATPGNSLPSSSSRLAPPPVEMWSIWSALPLLLMALTLSPPPIIGLGTSQMVGGSVEQSNTDIADEFSKMIVTQQAYSANTKVITTAQEMLSAVFNIIR